MTIRVPWQAWYGEAEQELAFPAGWQVRVANMADAPPASGAVILQALQNPIGTPSLRELAQERKKAAPMITAIQEGKKMTIR